MTWWDKQDRAFNDQMLSTGINAFHDGTRNWIFEHTEGKRVLDVGCGTGMGYRAGGRESSYTGVDFSPQMVQVCREWLPEATWLVGEVAALPFADRSFDVAVARHVFDHIDDYEPGIAEMHRVAEQIVVVLFHPIGTGYRDDALGVVDRSHDERIVGVVGATSIITVGEQTVLVG